MDMNRMNKTQTTKHKTFQTKEDKEAWKNTLKQQLKEGYFK